MPISKMELTQSKTCIPSGQVTEVIFNNAVGRE